MTPGLTGRVALPLRWITLRRSTARGCRFKEEKVKQRRPGGAPPRTSSSWREGKAPCAPGTRGAGPPTPSSPANCYGTTLGDSKFTFKKKLASPHICKVKAQKAFYKPKPLFSRAYSFTN